MANISLGALKAIRRPAGKFPRTGFRFVPLHLILLVTAAGVGLQKSKVVAADPVAVVELTNQLTYTPQKVTVNVGDTVEWKNRSLLVHTVTADPVVATKHESVILPKGAEPFDSGKLDPESNFRHTFKVPGTYRYFCIPHEGAAMVGEVVVKPAATSRRTSFVSGLIATASIWAWR